MASQRGRNAFEMVVFLIALAVLLGTGIYYIGAPEVVVSASEEEKTVEPQSEDQVDESEDASITYTIDPEKVGDIVDGLLGGEEASEGGMLNSFAERIRNRNKTEEPVEEDEEE